MTAPSSPSVLSIRKAVKRYGTVQALGGIELDIGEGEFLTLLGPSGSGKTTLLTAIAGFTGLDEGRLVLRGKDITDLPPDRRDFGMVFQGYALFPTMNVRNNIAFPLKVRKWKPADIQARVEECLALVQMEGFADRMPSQLSGGQQQRVALARALSFRPSVLLLDEPLSALDKKLRADLQWELKDLHRKLGVTFIYVTHDQDEALSMSDRIVILKDGLVQQIGEPGALYNAPRTTFVADFLGKSNFLDVEVEGFAGGRARCRAGGESFEVATEAPPAGGRGRVALRPERIRLAPPKGAAFEGAIRQTSYLGERCHVILDHPGFGQILVSCPTWKSGVVPEDGLPVSFDWDADACVFLEDA
ncbi:putative spermidine/putrescine transport system ATP-binding protein [Tistlia consotensis]|uniref:Putative spermidine/putrescine transport system ATP-binding protein n=1 Tax=Tistlia consotensis USBA 355 TaxID=560819 RepID=A0A1Y6B6D9_9PROT|nr:ABC transporter ATP-binding protein [Tistlia consotensis]SME92620.1 putative spermidine/putrescine transport system ATP-binding protein [Tistlia consotensis USBA 355]SNR28119.1 putative spermidine/putrescine transport system ATP-binding protein [Tistlia consotensis]